MVLLSDWTSRYVVLSQQPVAGPKEQSKNKCSSFEERRSTSQDQQLQARTWRVLSQCHPNVAKVFYEGLRFRQLTPIQALSLPLLLCRPPNDPLSPLSGDVVIAAPTGEGKTLCYVLPIVSSLLYRPNPCVRVIVLTPTRELARQVARMFRPFCGERPSEATALGGRGWGVTWHPSAESRRCAARQASSSATSPPAAPLRILTLGESAGCFATEAAELRGENPPDVVIATPGRFVEHSQAASCGCRALASRDPKWSGQMRWVVLDEMDQLLEQTFEGWVAELNRIASPPLCVGPRPQRIAVSATLTQDPEKLASLGFLRPLFLVASQTERDYLLPPRLKQLYAIAPRAGCSTEVAKALALIYILHQVFSPQPFLSPPTKKRRRLNPQESKEATASDAALDVAPCAPPNAAPDAAPPHKVLVFCSTKRSARQIAKLLRLHFGRLTQLPPPFVTPFPFGESSVERIEAGGVVMLKVEEFTASLPQAVRTRLLEAFSASPRPTERSSSATEGAVDVLVCSDLASRGLDMPGVDLVLNYDVPISLESYVHRAGRTCRAGRPGAVLTLIGRDELPKLRRRLARCPNKGWAPGESGALWDTVQRHRIQKGAMVGWLQESATAAGTRGNPVDGRAEVLQTYQQLLWSELEQ